MMKPSNYFNSSNDKQIPILIKKFFKIQTKANTHCREDR